PRKTGRRGRRDGARSDAEGLFSRSPGPDLSGPERSLWRADEGRGRGRVCRRVAIVLLGTWFRIGRLLPSVRWPLFLAGFPRRGPDGDGDEVRPSPGAGDRQRARRSRPQGAFTGNLSPLFSLRPLR